MREWEIVRYNTLTLHNASCSVRLRARLCNSENCLLCTPLCQLIQRLPYGWTLTCYMSAGKHARPWRLRCCRCHNTDRRVSYSLIRLSRLQTVSPWCCMFLLLLLLLMNIQFSVNSTIMLYTALRYASICSYASTLLLCSKLLCSKLLCQQNSPKPTY